MQILIVRDRDSYVAVINVCIEERRTVTVYVLIILVDWVLEQK